MRGASQLDTLTAFRNLWVDGMQEPQVRRLSVSKAENEHEKASLFVHARVQDFDSMLGARVSFDYGAPGSSMTFLGYVAAVNPQQAYTGQQFTTEQEIVLLGPSMVTKGNRPRFFTDVTVPQAIARICADNSLGFSDETRGNPTSWRTLAQTSETDWEMLLKLANRIGAHVLIQRGVVRLIDYNDVAFRQLPSHFLQLRSQLPIQDDADSSKDSILSFQPVSLSAIDPTYRTPAMAFLEGGQAVYVPATKRTGPVSRRFATDMPARSMNEAQDLQQGYYYPEWSQEADLTAAGDATIEPATMLQVNSGNRVAFTLAPEYDGLWYVRKLTHWVSANRFTTNMTLGRPPIRASNWYPEKPFWVGSNRGLPTLIAAGDGTWISTWR